MIKVEEGGRLSRDGRKEWSQTDESGRYNMNFDFYSESAGKM